MTKEEMRALATLAATRAPVVRVAAGVTALGLTDRDWYRRVRDGGRAVDSERLAERRAEVAHDAAFTGDRQFAAEVAGGMWDHTL